MRSDRSCLRQISLAGLLLAGALIPGASFGQVVPDGTTSTNVVIGADGSVSVGIAPAGTNGVSLNRYDDFNVRKPGVRLDNRQDSARTIVNEVTGRRGTEIEGTLEVVGQRAHVIVANPNGIVIDGGRFVNTGRVALTTGRIGQEERVIAPGVTREDITATVSAGTIRIGPGGLAGQMDAVDLIAHDFRIGGPVTNTSGHASASLSLVAGPGISQFDSSVVPGNAGATWRLSRADEAAADPDRVIVEIERPGVLRSNRIGIEVNGRGAGVRFAGQGLAGARGFTLRADGRVDLDGAQISASNGAVQVQAGALAVKGGLIEARGPEADEDGDPAVLAITSADDMSFDGASLVSDGAIVLTADGAINFSETDAGADLLLTADSKDVVSLSDSGLRSKGNLLLSADSVRVSGDDRQSEIVAEQGSLAITTHGKSGAGDVINRGGLIQGGQGNSDLSDLGDQPLRGAVTMNVAGDLVNHSGSQLSVIFGAAGDVDLQVGGRLENLSGRILANGDVRIDVAADFLNADAVANGPVTPDISRTTSRGKRLWWTGWQRRERNTTTVLDYGAAGDPEQRGTILATGSARIDVAGQFLNDGGDVTARDGDLQINARDVETRLRTSGRLVLNERCRLRCRTRGEGVLLSYGGGLIAGGDLQITAATTFLNDGGRVEAGNDLRLDSPGIIARPAYVPTIVERPAGLYNLWSGRSARLHYRGDSGSLSAAEGAVEIRSDTFTRGADSLLNAGGRIEISGTDEIVKRPGGLSTAFGEEIGWLRKLPVLVDD